jgi:hypothetical protein
MLGVARISVWPGESHSSTWCLTAFGVYSGCPPGAMRRGQEEQDGDACSSNKAKPRPELGEGPVSKRACGLCQGAYPGTRPLNPN